MATHCEICGSIIQGQPRRILVGAATLLVCSRCVRYGTPTSRPRLPSSSRPPVPRAAEPQLDVVPDCSVRVKKAREEMGLTQEVLAKLTREKVSVIRRIEAGKLKPTLDLAKRLERVLRVSLVEEVEDTKGSGQPRHKADLTLGDVAVVREGRQRG